jgi:hypothetical protein
VNSFISIWQKKSRIATRSIATLIAEKDILNPFKYGIFAIQVWTKSILRRLSLLFLLGIMISNVLLVLIYNASMLYKITLILQIILWCWSLVSLTWLMLFGKKLSGLHRKSLRAVLLLPTYFLLVNIAAFWGYIKFLVTRRACISWEKAR